MRGALLAGVLVAGCVVARGNYTILVGAGGEGTVAMGGLTATSVRIANEGPGPVEIRVDSASRALAAGETWDVAYRDGMEIRLAATGASEARVVVRSE